MSLEVKTMAEKAKLTKSGYENLKRELDYLIHDVREEVKKELAEARAQGDLSENADYDAARNRQAEVEARIKQIEDTLNNAEIIQESSKKHNRVGLGSQVSIRFLNTNKEASYQIVGTIESDPINGKISNVCALGEALLGKIVGDVVEVKSNVPYKVEILKIESL